MDFQKIKSALDQLHGELDKIRASIAEKEDELDQLKGAPVPPADVIAALHGFIDSNAARYPESLRALAAVAFSPEFKPNHINFQIHLFGQKGDTLDHTAATCFFFGDLMKKRIKEAVQALGDYGASAPKAQRPARIKQLTDEIKLLEEAEENFIVQAELGGFPVARRPEIEHRRAVEAEKAALEERNRQWAEDDRQANAQFLREGGLRAMTDSARRMIDHGIGG